MHDAPTWKPAVPGPIQRRLPSEGGKVNARWFLWVAVAIGWLGVHPASAAAPTHTLDLVTFAVPAGWKVEERTGDIGKAIMITRASPASYCMIGIYSSAPASGDLDASFTAEWQRVALRSIAPVPAPKPAATSVGDARAVAGAAASKAWGQPVIAVLTVIDAGASVVPILVLTPTAAAYDAYSTEVHQFLGSIAVQRVGDSAAAPVAASDATLASPAPPRPTLVSDLAGEWGRNDGINTRYVDRYTGVYAGADSNHSSETWVISPKGTISYEYFGLVSGNKIREQSMGSVTLSAGGILVIKIKNEEKYILRGWLETPTMTVMTLNGPWYEDIPANILNDPEQGSNLDKKWVRLTKGK